MSPRPNLLILFGRATAFSGMIFPRRILRLRMSSRIGSFSGSIQSAAAVLLLSGTLSGAQSLRALSGHVPSVVTNLQAIGLLPATNHLHLAIGLPLRNQPALTDFIHRLYDPTSPDFHQYLTPSQFAAKFGPTESDYQTAIVFAKKRGFTVTATYPNRMLLDVDASVANIENAFHVTLRMYRHPTENRTFFAPDTEPSVEASIPLLHITGLDNFILPDPADLHVHPLDTSATPSLGSQFRACYAPGVALDGTGESVGIVAFDGYYTNDIAEFELIASEPNVLVTNILLDGYSGAAGANNDETAMDIQMAISMAPGLASVMVYEGIYSDSVLNRMASDDLCKQLTSSWTYTLSDNILQDYQEFEAQGQVMFQASGDNGNYDNLLNTPLGDPDLVTVGGTLATTAYTGGPWSSETAWQGSGGGISPSYGIPAYQQGLNMTANHGSTTQRNLPDVSMMAGSIFVFANNGQLLSGGGTSASSPLWAGFAALVNQQAAMNSEPSPGFLNPALYSIGQSSNYLACFHDITTGNNTNSSSGNNFFAVPGYDLCTGWGTPTGSNLINALAPFYALRVTPLAGSVFAGQSGQIFGSASFILTNAGTTSVTWSVENASAWLAVSPSGGTLGPGETASVAVATGPVANFLSAGEYTADISFDYAGGPAQQRQFILTINPLIQNGGFETGDFSNWTLTGTNTICTVTSSGSQPPDVYSGNYGATLANVGSLAYLSQSIPTVAGGAYVLSCWLNSSANPNKSKKTTPNQFQVSWNGTTLFSQANIGAIGWTNLQFVVSATGTNSALQFGFRDDPWALGFDDVTLQAIASPVIQTATKTSQAMNFTWGVTPGAQYQLQYKTNLTQASWSNLGSPVAATNLALVLIDPNASASQRFYRIVLSH